MEPIIDTPPPDDKPPRAEKNPPKRTPPKREDKKPTGRPAGRANASSVVNIENAMNEFFAAVSMGFQFAGDDVMAVIFASRGPKVAEAWAELARINPGVRKVIEKMLTGSAWSGVAISSLSIAMPVAERYGVFPDNLPNPFALSLDEVAAVTNLRSQRLTNAGVPDSPTP